ncbi:hypothetical protein F444_02754 [Plasmopara halstedii]|uniref:Myb-like domain-containing protein n=1 Tax=Plasmopara halstedii TaxID=4781 RepID=A0A0P1AHS9_PLAHL|nr:hypothetical protein F444_02754 [Plasmopara halstedii]CEG40232.1 hypothetical protein F444_02754 [Plasmopara halstedii]|eukprot:XP_024576601.1 hypothetical protein F444_02754 [Plasmopara halstedii]
MGKRGLSSNSCGNQHESPWAPEEHQRFVLALEQFGGGQYTSNHQAWQQITTAVGSRDTSQVMQHARHYFAHLQHLNSQKQCSFENTNSIWSSDEDAAFEKMLATYSSSSVCYPWDVMASHFDGKSAADLKERYQKLCHDIARIENAPQTFRFDCHGRRDFSRTNLMIEKRDQLMSDLMSPRVLDSVISLTPIEEEILIEAMTDVFVPPQAPAELLAGIASAVAAFTNSSGRVPPQRTHSIFTKEQALKVLNRLLAAQETDPQIVLETLAYDLRLHPQSLNVSAGVSFSSNSNDCSPSTSTFETLTSTENPMSSKETIPFHPSSSPSSNQLKQDRSTDGKESNKE